MPKFKHEDFDKMVEEALARANPTPQEAKQPNPQALLQKLGQQAEIRKRIPRKAVR